jgi:hypothetical protein
MTPSLSQRATHLIATTLVVQAFVVAVALPIWCNWPSDQPSPNQWDAAISPSKLINGITAIVSALPAFLLRAETWKNIGLFFVWLGAVLGWGGLGQRFLLYHLTRNERTILRFSLGILWLGLATVVMGLAGGFRSGGFIAMLLVGWLFFVPSARACWRGKWAHFRLGGKTPVFTALSTLITIYLFFLLLYALTPPIQSDGMRYHLAAIQEWLRRGRVVYLPLNAFSNFPFLIEMHFAFGVAAGLPEQAQLVHFTFFLAAGGTLYAMTARMLHAHARRWSRSSVGQVVAWLPTWLYWTMPAHAIVAAWPFIDQAVTFYWLVSIFAAYLALERGRLSDFAVLGSVLGAALGTKYTSLAYVALMIPAVLSLHLTAQRSQPRPIRKLVRNFLFALALMVLTSFVWFAKNIAYTGNPLYPLAGSIFGYGEFGPANVSLYAAKMAEKGISKTPANVLLSPLAATFHWIAFEHHFLSAHLLVGLLLAAPGFLLCRARTGRTWHIFIFVFALLLYALWFFTYQSNRMLGPPTALFFLGASFGLSHLAMQSWARRAGFIACALTAFYGLLYNVQYVTTIHRPPTSAYLSGALSRDEYLAEALNYYRAYRWLGDHVRTGEKVLLIGEHRIFYAPFEGIWSDWFDTPAILAIMREEKTTDVPALLKALHRRGIAWILVNDTELAPQLARYWKPRFSPHEWQLYESLLSHCSTQRVRIPPGVTVFRIFSVDERTTQ